MKLGELSLDDFLAAARDLLAIPSTADRPHELVRALDYVVDFARGPGIRVERFESQGKQSALLYSDRFGPGRPSFPVIFNAHLDVVPAPDDMFVPRIDGDRIHARGAQDMKISGLALATVFREQAATLPFPIALQLVTDEELGGRNGTKVQVDDGVTGEFVIIGEHSGLDIVADSKGVLQATLHATGLAGHGAYPWLGQNALLRLVGTVNRLMAVYPPVAEAAWRTTVNVAKISTPNHAFNQIPASAEGWLDIRFPMEDAHLAGATTGQAADYLATFCEQGVTVSVEHIDPPHHADHDALPIKLLRDAAQSQGYGGEFLYKHGAGDGRFYSVHQIPAVSFGVAGAGQHGPDEFADVTTIAPYRRALTHFLRLLAGT
jgi:succinyl-diaminopimelate desuccinylase